ATFDLYLAGSCGDRSAFANAGAAVGCGKGVMAMRGSQTSPMRNVSRRAPVGGNRCYTSATLLIAANRSRGDDDRRSVGRTDPTERRVAVGNPRWRVLAVNDVDARLRTAVGVAVPGHGRQPSAALRGFGL